MNRIGIIFGGRSFEHEVSLMSAVSVMKVLDPEKFEIIPIGITKDGDWKKYIGPIADIENGAWEKTATPFNPGDLKKEIDFAFPILHGPYGEDGTIQGLFEMLDIPYAGCGVLASALAMDKIVAKELFTINGLPSCSYVSVFGEELTGERELHEAIERIEKQLSNRYPVFVKPSNMGSSVGVSKAKNREELISALKAASKYDRRLIVEEGIDGRELETAIIGNYTAEAAVVGEILPSAEFYDYRAKYFDGGQSKLCIPADISPKLSEKIREIALKAYQTLDCTGFARVDFFLENGTDRMLINEINTIPGFTKYSMFPLLWESAGVVYSRLIERIVELGYERHYAKNHR